MTDPGPAAPTSGTGAPRLKFQNVSMVFPDGTPAGVKAAMHMLGRDSGEMRLPLAPASESACSALALQLKRVGLLR